MKMRQRRRLQKQRTRIWIVGSAVPTCDHGCNGGENCTDYDDDYDDSDDYVCPRCYGEGMDPWSDYLFPCPECRGDYL